MYRVLLVDDEPWSIIGIKKIFKWAEQGFEVVGTACDAYEALEKMGELKPHVVFTDIRMPEMSGLELIERVREKGCRCEFVAISGFAEFQYAQQAIRLNVLDYIIKPISAKNAEALLIRLKEHLDKRFIEEDYLDVESLSNDASFSSFRRICASRDVEINGDKFYISAVCCEEMGLTDDGGTLCLRFGAHEGVPMYLVFHNDIGRTEGCLRGSCECKGEAGLKKAVKTAVACLYTAVFMGYASYDFNEYSVKRRVESIDSFMLTASRLYEEGNKGKIDEFVKTLPEAFKARGCNLDDAVMLVNHAAILNGEHNMLFDKDSVIEEFGNFKGACAFIGRQLKGAEEADVVNEGMAQLISYVDGHFAEGVSLSELAERFYINFTYASSLFKKTTGVTFSQYITELRMKRARSMLKDPALSIARISELCGYEDSYYFNKVFKKYYGISPSAYRGR